MRRIAGEPARDLRVGQGELRGLRVRQAREILAARRLGEARGWEGEEEGRERGGG
jgi:hypothetical protein